MEEELFSRGKYKVFATIHALQHPVLEFHGFPFQPHPQHCQDSASFRPSCTPELCFRLRDCANDCSLLCVNATQALLELLTITKVTAYRPASYTGKRILAKFFNEAFPKRVESTT
jgi:hypothetical protein